MPVKVEQDMLQPTVAAIYRSYEDAQEPARGHLGASLIGRPCSRELWYSFHWVQRPNFSGRILRLFERGQNEERTFEDNLRAAGVDVSTLDPRTGEQYRVEAHGGHFAGSLDARLMGLLEAPKTEHVGEFKTHSAKSFKELAAKGVQESKPEHYAQMQVYMLLSNLKRAYYLAVNKDTDELYSERVRLDKDFAQSLLDKAKTIIEAEVPPDGISHDPSWWQCKFCDFSDHCHGLAGHEFPETNCRTCAHSTPVENGDAAWTCARNEGDTIPFAFQRKGCADHVFNPALVNLDAVDSDLEQNWISYRLADGQMFKNGTDHVASRTLSNGGMAALDGVVDAIKKPLGAKW